MHALLFLATAALLPLPHVGGIAHILTALRSGSSLVTSAASPGASLNPVTTPSIRN